MKLSSSIVLLCLSTSVARCGINMVEGPPEMKEWLKNSPPNRECKREGFAREWLCTEFNYDANEVTS